MANRIQILKDLITQAHHSATNSRTLTQGFEDSGRTGLVAAQEEETDKYQEQENLLVELLVENAKNDEDFMPFLERLGISIDDDGEEEESGEETEAPGKDEDESSTGPVGTGDSKSGLSAQTNDTNRAPTAYAGEATDGNRSDDDDEPSVSRGNGSDEVREGDAGKSVPRLPAKALKYAVSKGLTEDEARAVKGTGDTRGQVTKADIDAAVAAKAA